MAYQIRPPKPMKPYSAEWERQANELARGMVPEIYPCGDCGGPVARGHRCTRCGSTNPERVRDTVKELVEA